MSDPSDPMEAERPHLSLINRLRALMRWRHNSIREDLEDALSEDGEDTPEFSPEERSMLKNVLDLREMRVEDVMVPRADVVAVPSTITLGDLLKCFQDAEHSRLPVYEETLDDAQGIVHIKDVLSHLITAAMDGSAEGKIDLSRVDLARSLKDVGLIRQVLYVPPSMQGADLLAKMQATRMHMALVIDEYGGTDGLVTIEDLIETVVGDIVDEHDSEEEPSIIRIAPDAFIADARAFLEDLAEETGLEEEDFGGAAEEVDTLGGLVVAMLGRVPTRGELLSQLDKVHFEILDADARRVKQVKVWLRDAAKTEPENEDTASE